MQHATGFRRLTFELHDEVHDLARIRASVHQVAGHDEVCICTRPVQVGIDHLRVLQRAYHGGKGAVRIADRDNSRHIRPAVLLRSTQRRHEKKSQDGPVKARDNNIADQ